eukprot:4854429-Lingulodinium_polyedra.AAC.1
MGKGKYLEGHSGDPDFDILRFITHFVPFNAVFRPVLGDVEQLPYIGQWSNLQLEAWACRVALGGHLARVLRHQHPGSVARLHGLQLVARRGSVGRA